VTETLPGFKRPLLDEPLVILTYAYSGVARLRTLVEELPGLVWIGADLVASCDQLASDWRQVEGRGDAFSNVAQAAIRSMFNTMIMMRLANSGATRYSIRANGNASLTERFATLYPKAKFVCLHRTLLDVAYSAVANNPWGLSDSPCAQYAFAYPGNSVAAVTAYWVQQTEQLLAVEQAHQDRVLRLRYEDLDADPQGLAESVGGFIDPKAMWERYPGDGSWSPRPAAENAATRATTPVGCGASVPPDRIPAPMRNVVNQLLAELKYQPLPT